MALLDPGNVCDGFFDFAFRRNVVGHQDFVPSEDWLHRPVPRLIGQEALDRRVLQDQSRETNQAFVLGAKRGALRHETFNSRLHLWCPRESTRQAQVWFSALRQKVVGTCRSKIVSALRIEALIRSKKLSLAEVVRWLSFEAKRKHFWHGAFFDHCCPYFTSKVSSRTF